MTSDLRQLYRDVILDHAKGPRNFRVPPGTNRTGEGHNPLCGDRLTIYLRVEREVIEDVGFKGAGCAISMASASMMTVDLKGRSVGEAIRVFERFCGLVTGPENAMEDSHELGDLRAFAGVRGFSTRVKCATLAWHTFHGALTSDGESTKVSTE
jgi:nitrogen fixation NifU-like protein